MAKQKYKADQGKRNIIMPRQMQRKLTEEKEGSFNETYRADRGFKGK